MSSAASKCAGVCKEPSYHLNDLTGIKAYRDRPVASSGVVTDKFLGKSRAVEIVLQGNEFCYIDKGQLVKIERCYWDNSWKPEDPARVKKTQTPKFMLIDQCTCNSSPVSLQEAIGKVVFRDRPQVFYPEKQGKPLPVDFLTFYGPNGRVKILRDVVNSKLCFFGIATNNTTSLIGPSLDDNFWRIYEEPETRLSANPVQDQKRMESGDSKEPSSVTIDMNDQTSTGLPSLQSQTDSESESSVELSILENIKEPAPKTGPSNENNLAERLIATTEDSSSGPRKTCCQAFRDWWNGY